MASVPFCSQLGRYSFLYPVDWDLRRVRSPEAKEEFFIAGPMGRGGTHNVSLSVRVTAAPQRTAEDAARAFHSSYQKAFGCRLLGRASGAVAGVAAEEVEVTYEMPLPLKSADPRPTAIRERHVYFKRGDDLFELQYAAAEEDYEAWLPAFRTLVQTFTFEEPAGAGFRPLVAPAASGPA